jgi:hypothetical protein
MNEQEDEVMHPGNRTNTLPAHLFRPIL